MAQRKEFMRAYFIVMICYGIIGLLNHFLFNGNSMEAASPMWWNVIGSIAGIGVFVLSIIAIVVSVKDKFPKITLVMPIAELGVTFVMFIYGFVLGIKLVLSGGAEADIIFHPFMFTFALLFSIFELLFSSFVLTKLNSE